MNKTIMDFLREMLSQNGIEPDVIESILKDTQYHEAGVERSIVNQMSMPICTSYAPGAYFSTDDFGRLMNIAAPLSDSESKVARNFMFLPVKGTNNFDVFESVNNIKNSNEQVLTRKLFSITVSADPTGRMVLNHNGSGNILGKIISDIGPNATLKVADRNSATLKSLLGSYYSQPETIAYYKFYNPDKISLLKTTTSKNAQDLENFNLKARNFESFRPLSSFGTLEAGSTGVNGIYDLKNFNEPFKDVFADSFLKENPHYNFGLIKSLDFNTSVKQRYANDIFNKLEVKAYYEAEDIAKAAVDVFTKNVTYQADEFFSSFKNQNKAFTKTEFNSRVESFFDKENSKYDLSFSKKSFLDFSDELFSNRESLTVNTAQKELNERFGLNFLIDNQYQKINQVVKNMVGGSQTDYNSVKNVISNLTKDSSNGVYNGIIQGLTLFKEQNGESTKVNFQKVFLGNQTGFETTFGNKEFVALNGKLNNFDFNFNLKDLTIENFDFHRAMEIKVPAMVLFDKLLASDPDVDSKTLKTSFKLLNRNVKNNGGATPELFKKTPELLKLYNKVVDSGVPVNLTELVQRGKTVIAGKSSTYSPGIVGNLSVFNDSGARAFQSIEALPDYVRNEGNYLVNVTRSLVDSKLDSYGSKRGALLSPDLFYNKDLSKFDELNNRLLERYNPKNYAGYTSLETRGNVNGVLLNILGSYEGDTYKPGGFGYNESIIMHEDITDVLYGAKDKRATITEKQFRDIYAENLKKSKTENIDELLQKFDSFSQTEKIGFVKEQLLNPNLVGDVTPKNPSISARNNFFKGMKFDFSYDVDDLSFMDFRENPDDLHLDGITSENGVYNINFRDVTKAGVSTKIHTNDYFKGEIAATGKLKVSTHLGGEFNDIAGATAVKNFKRGFSGTDISNFLKMALYSSSDDDSLIKELQNLTVNGEKIDLLSTLGLTLEKTEAGFSFSDRHTGTNGLNTDTVLKRIDSLIDNPFVDSTLEKSKTTARLKELGLQNTESIINLINNAYEKINSNKPHESLIGDFDLELNGVRTKVKAIKTITGFMNTSSHQKAVIGNAFKLDSFSASFLENKGYSELADNIRTTISNNNDYLAKKLGVVSDLTYTNSTPETILSALETHKKNNIVGQDNFIDFKTGSLKNFMNDFSEHRNLSENEFFELLKKHGVNAEDAINAASKIQNNLSLYDYSGDAFEYFKKHVSSFVGDEFNLGSKKGQTNSEVLYNAGFSNYKKHLEKYFKSNVGGDSTITRDLKQAHNLLINQLEKITDKTDGQKFILNLLKSSSVDKTDLARVYGTLFNAEHSYTVNTDFNLAFANQEGKNFFNGVVNKIKVGSLMEDFQVYSELEKTMTGNLLENDQFLNKLEQLRTEINSEGFNKLSVFDSAFIKTLSGTIEPNNSQLIKSLTKFVRHTNSNAKGVTASKEAFVALFNNYYEEFYKGSYRSVNQNHLGKVISDVRIKLAKDLFITNPFEKENLTKKGTSLHEYSSFKVANSISGHTIDNSHYVDVVSEEFKKLNNKTYNNINAFKKEKFYTDLREVFGSNFVDDFIINGLDKHFNNGKLTITEEIATEFKRHIDAIEHVVLVSEESLMHNSATKEFAKFKNLASKTKVLNKKGFIGMFARFPIQSTENFATTMNFLINKTVDTENFFLKALNDGGFNKSSLGTMIWGKKTALAMNLDFDGDKTYLSNLRELFKNDKAFKEFEQKGILEVFAANTNNIEALRNKDYSVFEKYGINFEDAKTKVFAENIVAHYDTYNELLAGKLKNVLNNDHFNPAHLLFNSEENLDLFNKFVAKNSVESLEATAEKIVSNHLGGNTAFSKYLKTEISEPELIQKVTKYLKKAKEGNLINNNFLESSMKDSQIRHAGIVWSSVNEIRNTNQILGTLNIDKDTIQGFYKSEIAKRKGIKVSEVAQEDVERMLKDSITRTGSSDVRHLAAKMNAHQENIKKANAILDSLFFNSIEAGVISGKHNTRMFYQTMEDLNSNLHSDVSGYDKLTELIADIKTSKTSSEIETKIAEARKSGSFAGGIFNDLFDILGDEKYYQAYYVPENASEIDKLDVYNKRIGAIENIVEGTEGVAQINSVLSGGQTNFDFAKKRLNLDIASASKKGFFRTLFNKTQKETHNSLGDIELAPNERMINRKVLATIDRVQKSIDQGLKAALNPVEQQETITEKVEAVVDNVEATVKNAEVRARELAGKFDNFSEYAKNNKGKVGLAVTGLMALGSFLTYSTAKRVSSSFERENQFLGNVPGGANYQQSNDLGYMNYNKWRER